MNLPFLTLWTAGLILLSGLVSSHAAQKNVLLICVDDLKPVLGCYGDTLIKSPNIDRLASRGMLYERAFCNQAVCAPSRNALMTGLRPSTLGIYDLGTNFRRSRPATITLSQHLKNHGWQAEALGKIFHVGHGNHEDAQSWSVPHWGPGTRPNPGVKPASATPAKSSTPKKQNQAQPQRGPATVAADVPDNEYGDGKIAEEAIRRLRNFKQTPEKPFFLAVGFLKPHLPFVAPKKYWDLYHRTNFSPHPLQSAPLGAPSFAPTSWGELRNYTDIPSTGPLTPEMQRQLIHGYYAATSYMDAQLGKVLDELDVLGLSSNTLIILWGDHGWHLGDHGMWCKHTNFEQATRIPLICVDPSAKPGRCQGLVETVDLYPTLCELVGLKPPADLDGHSFAATLKNPGAPTKDAVFHIYPRGSRELGALLGRAVRTERYRLVEWKPAGAPAEKAVLELYDYQKDPQETRNWAQELPQVAKQLREILSREPEAKPQIPATAP